MINITIIFRNLKLAYHATLRSYGMLFFSTETWFSWIILIITFFIPPVGVAGFAGTVISLGTARLLGFDPKPVSSGIYSYSSLLYGLGLASYFEWGLPFILLLLIGSVLCTLFSVALSSRLVRKNIPGLSLAFIFTSWIVWLAGYQFGGIGLTQRHIYWFNELYSVGGSPLIEVQQWLDGLALPAPIAGYFRSMSAILFQNSLLAGIILSVGLLLHSRIAFSLSILGYVTAITFFNLMGGFHQGQVSYYNLGTNFMLVSMALGGFYIVPSVRSYLWVLISVPIAYILVVGLGNIFAVYGLPVFSLPFCLTVMLFLYCLPLRSHPGKLTLTPIQSYRPETNLYRYKNDQGRSSNALTFPLILPVMGEWMISQGYDGTMTHQGEWKHALDFVLLDEEHKTFQWPANRVEDFYTYGKPVLAPGDGVVVEVINHVLDNSIGEINTHQNWGNTIIIQHTHHLYSKLSHLKPGSIRIAKGSYVKKGDIIGACGNSGRSPEPHLHFQIQSTPYIGSKTMRYPITAFLERKDQHATLKLHSIPQEGHFVRNLPLHADLTNAFTWQNGMQWMVCSDDGRKETWEAGVSIYNETYLHCTESDAYAYYTVTDTQFRFLNYYGSRNSLLFSFYLNAYHVLFSKEIPTKLIDQLPLHLINIGLTRWLLDFISPFWIPIEIKYEAEVENINDSSQEKICWHSTIYKHGFIKKRIISNGKININQGKIESFIFEDAHQKNIEVSIQCVD